MERVPLMVLSDSPSGKSGLGRIARELTLRIHQDLADVFEVCTYGLGEPPSDALPFRQYEMRINNLVPTNLPQCWKHFAGERKGAILSIFNISWIPWLADPEKFATGELREFLLTQPFARWGYFPIDGDCRPERLPLNMAEAICGFDRVAHYTNWSKRITDTAIAEIYPKRRVGSAVLPHGLDTSVFYPRDREVARATLFQRVTGGEGNPIKDSVTLLGVVASNTPRKDWGLVFETTAELVRRGVDIGLWIHTDHLRKSWDLVGLAREYDLTGRTIASAGELTDDDLAWAYSACDATLAPASGGGWEFPISESLACGVPVVHGDYAGGAEITPKNGLVTPIGYRHDGFFGVRRPVHDSGRWADVVQSYGCGGRGLSLLAPYIDWNNAWPVWKEWLLKGIGK